MKLHRWCHAVILAPRYLWLAEFQFETLTKMLCFYRTEEVGGTSLEFERMLEQSIAFHLVFEAEVGLNWVMDPVSILTSIPASFIFALN